MCDDAYWLTDSHLLTQSDLIYQFVPLGPECLETAVAAAVVQIFFLIYLDDFWMNQNQKKTNLRPHLLLFWMS